jgi:hypothetical protein
VVGAEISDINLDAAKRAADACNARPNKKISILISTDFKEIVQSPMEMKNSTLSKSL